MAAESDTVELTADSAQTVTLSEPFTKVEVVVLSITGASSVVIFANTKGATAVADADDLDVVAGGIGAYNQFTARLGTTSVSLIASEDCKVLVKRV